MTSDYLCDKFSRIKVNLHHQCYIFVQPVNLNEQQCRLIVLVQVHNKYIYSNIACVFSGLQVKVIEGQETNLAPGHTYSISPRQSTKPFIKQYWRPVIERYKRALTFGDLERKMGCHSFCKDDRSKKPDQIYSCQYSFVGSHMLSFIWHHDH